MRDAERGWLLFRSPGQVLEARKAGEVAGVLAQAEAHADSGGHAVGFLAYESAPAFEPRIQVQAPKWPILAWFALYENEPDLYRELEPAEGWAEVDAHGYSFDSYREAFDQVKQALAEGAIYQANITFKLPIRSSVKPAQLFSSLCGVNPPPYATYIHGGDWHIVSLSPELFFSREGSLIQMRPMKGTATPSPDSRERTRQIERLRQDPKTIAENIMIVDMVRNDLGRFAEVGSVQTPSLLDVEQHRTVLQVTSTVTAHFEGPTSQVFGNAFPPASVTGAPKLSACRTIAELETEPRDVYCGAIGYLAPERKAVFSVGIRTARFDGSGKAGEYGVGSGIVWDSEAELEYEECLSKAKVLESPASEWALLESMPDTLTADSPQLERHLARLARSAEFFHIPFNRAAILAALDLPRQPQTNGKLRLLLNRKGEPTVEQTVSLLPPGRLTAKLAPRPVDSTDPRLRHKTTSRSLYNDLLAHASGFDEVLLHNERGEAVSFCNGNLIAQIGGQWVTPSPDSGCLEGVGLWRFALDQEVQTRRILVSELAQATRILLTNAVVGTREIDLDRAYAERVAVGRDPR